MWDVCQTTVFEDWWCELSEQEQDDVTAVVELLAEKGPQLPFPYSSGVEGSRHNHMRELRIQSHGDPLRVFYAFDPNRSALLLIGGNKTGKDKRFYKTMIPKADALYDEHLNSLNTQPKPCPAPSLNSPRTSALSAGSASSSAKSSCGRK